MIVSMQLDKVEANEVGFAGKYVYLTDVITMRCPAPAEPLMSATIKLGTIAKHRVKRFRSHGFNRKSRKPFKEKLIQ